jgi:hypothetical protein
MMLSYLCPSWMSKIAFRLVRSDMYLLEVALLPPANVHDFEYGHSLHDDQQSMCGHDRENGCAHDGPRRGKFRSDELNLEFFRNQHCSESGSLPVPSSYRESATQSSNLSPRNCHESRLGAKGRLHYWFRALRPASTCSPSQICIHLTKIAAEKQTSDARLWQALLILDIIWLHSE